MKTGDRLKRAVDNPRLFIRGLNRMYHRRFGLRSENTNGISVFDKDWDNLIILDACRYDMFEQINRIEGTLTAKESKASATSEWLKANIAGRDLRDTIYVTANPQLESNREKWGVEFHNIKNVWINEGWDKKKGTVLADTMTEAAVEAYEQFPNKRLVVHYMQPHYPFVPSETDFDKGHLSSIKKGGDSPDGENVWAQKFIGEINVSQSKLWEMYNSNLEYVLDHVEELLTEISGKTVVTSDHGNYVGERASPIPIREYGHPRGLYDDVVTRVPWLEHTRGERREISMESDSLDQSTVESEVVSDRLRDLGYIE